MLSITDCVGMCGLSDDAADLLKSPKGTWQLRSYLLDALEASVARGDLAKERHLRDVLGALISAHPVPAVL